MKNFCLKTAVLSLALFAVWSCSDSEERRAYVSIVTVVENAQNEKLLQRGDSSLLKPENVRISSAVGQRILIEYEIKKTNPSNTPYRYEVHIEDYETLLTKDVIDLTTENQAKVGNDAFWAIYDMNSSGGFLNVYMAFLYNYEPHFINLVANEITPPVNTPDTLYLELRQNANGPNVGFAVRELVSFDMQEYIDLAKEANKAEFNVVVKVLLPYGVYSNYTVKFKTGAVNEEPNYNSLEVYKPTPNAAN